MSSIPYLSLRELYPAVAGETNRNTCGNPDCGNYGVAPDQRFAQLIAPGHAAAARRRKAFAADPALSAGMGRYRLGSATNLGLDRVSSVLEYDGDPHAWRDGRIMICQAARGNAECGVQFIVLSNEHLEAETTRLDSQNGLFDGPRCGACGKAYLDVPDEFAMNGANGKAVGRAGGPERAMGVRLIHKPCRGRKGARFTVSSEHRRPKDRSENLQLLEQLVNGAGINDLRRILTPAPGASEVGVKTIYDRIFWLERVLLAYERTQVKAWRDGIARRGEERDTRIAHDDVVLGVNWETSADRRITALNCSVSADIASGYVFRIDVDFDPTVDPLAHVEANYLGGAGAPALRAGYEKPNGKAFTARSCPSSGPAGTTTRRRSSPRLRAS